MGVGGAAAVRPPAWLAARPPRSERDRDDVPLASGLGVRMMVSGCDARLHAYRIEWATEGMFHACEGWPSWRQIEPIDDGSPRAKGASSEIPDGRLANRHPIARP